MFSNYIHSPGTPAFLVKLWKIVGEESTDEIVSWNQAGSSFIIHDSDRFCKELLPHYFKHGNSPSCASFIRQLNMYGFRKMMNFEKGNDCKELEFQQASFLRGKPELLANIKRKAPPSRMSLNASPPEAVDEPEANSSPKNLLTDLSVLREKQKNMDNTLTKMKQENELLWREISMVQQRHKAKEQVLQKVIQFLVQIIQRSNQNIQVPRKLARMLQDSSIVQENSSRVARIVDALRNKESDCIFVPDETASSPIGAVIHEVTDSEPDVLNNSRSLSTTHFNTSILKPLQKSSENSTFLPNSSAASIPLKPEVSTSSKNFHNESTSKETTPSISAYGSEMRYIAIPVAGDPNQLCLVPAENFTSQQISNFKPNAFCNVIALPAKETPTNNDATSNVFSISDEFPSNKSLNKVVNNESKFSVPDQVLSKGSNEGFSFVNNNFEDSSLSDLLKASKISSLEDDPMMDSTYEVPPIKNNSSSLPLSSESINYQLVVPESSSLVKSKKSSFQDFSILQDAVSSPSNFFLEQLLNIDDNVNLESFINDLSSASNNTVNNPSDDIMGNELVQLNPTTVCDEVELDQLSANCLGSPWFNLINQESNSSDSSLSKDLFCRTQDCDMSQSNGASTMPSTFELVKSEAAFTAPLYKSIPSNLEREKSDTAFTVPSHTFIPSNLELPKSEAAFTAPSHTFIPSNLELVENKSVLTSTTNLEVVKNGALTTPLYNWKDFSLVYPSSELLAEKETKRRKVI